MVDVPLDSYLVTITAVDQTRGQRDIATATFRAVAQDGLGNQTQPLDMYDKAGHPIRHTFSVGLNNPPSAKWLIRAENLYEPPIFAVDYHLDVTSAVDIRFVVTPKGVASRK